MRLIDADSLKEKFMSDAFREMVDDEPTAYDVEKVVAEMEEYEYSHLIEHDSEEAKHCVGAEDCDLSNCLLCVWTKAKAIVRNNGRK